MSPAGRGADRRSRRSVESRSRSPTLFAIVGAGAETVFYGFVLLLAGLPLSSGSGEPALRRA